MDWIRSPGGGTGTPHCSANTAYCCSVSFCGHSRDREFHASSSVIRILPNACQASLIRRRTGCHWSGFHVGTGGMSRTAGGRLSATWGGGASSDESSGRRRWAEYYLLARDDAVADQAVAARGAANDSVGPDDEVSADGKECFLLAGRYRDAEHDMHRGSWRRWLTACEYRWKMHSETWLDDAGGTCSVSRLPS